MKTSLACIPCFVRQTLEASRYVSDDPSLHESIMRRTLEMTASIDFAVPPPAVAQQIHRLVRELSGHEDPYAAAKRRSNRMALELLPELKARVSAADDRLDMAIRLAIAGNVIDLGVYSDFDRADLRHSVDSVIADELHGDVEEFRRAIHEAEHVLYIADNAGEIVFDRLLIEQLPIRRLTVAVRGGPVLNDATIADARAAALTDLVRVIDTGSDSPGVLLDDSSPTFRATYAEADCIVSKGQGNYEGLSGHPDADNHGAARLFFLLKVKCPPIAERTGHSVGSHLLLGRNHTQREATS